jgi:hypothetical protein
VVIDAGMAAKTARDRRVRGHCQPRALTLSDPGNAATLTRIAHHRLSATFEEFKIPVAVSVLPDEIYPVQRLR